MIKEDEHKEQTIIQNEALFDIFCKMIASDVWAGSMPSEESVFTVIKTSMLSNIDTFIECLLDKLEYDLFKAKQKVDGIIRAGRMHTPEYIYASGELGRAKRRRSQVIETIKQRRQGDNTKLSWFYDFLREKGMGNLIDEYKEFRTKLSNP